MKKRIVGIFVISLIIFANLIFAVGSGYNIFMENFVFSNADTGEVLSDKLCRNISVSGTIDNNGGSENAFFVVAVYDGRGVLSGINRKEVTLTDEIPVDITVENTLNAEKGMIVCFLWSIEKSMCPVSKTVVFTDGIIDYDKMPSQFYVSLSGSPEGDGSYEKPFDSIETARKYINSIKNEINEDIIVNIAEGVYCLSDTLYFDDNDSGVNGNKIIYKGSGIRNTVVSGGEKISGWEKEENGIYSVYLPEREYVKELYVNNRMAQRSKTENVVYGIDFYNDEAIIVNYDSKLATIKSYDNSELSSHGDWRDLRVKISKAEIHPDDDTKLLLYFTDGVSSVSKLKSNFSYKITESNNAAYAFTVENAKGLLDNENEFYFDKEEKKLYYKSENGKNPDNLDVYIPNLDALVVFKGSNSLNKVKNIEFENISFMHTSWDKMEDETYHTFQGVMFYPTDVEAKDIFPQVGMVPAAIQLDMAENIGFKNNTVACMGGVGIGIYNGVSNCDITENIITQTAHSGISVGLSSHQETDTKNNVAFRKPATASTYLSGSSPYSVTDGDCEYVWRSSLEDENAYVQIDLEKEYNINGIALNFQGARATVKYDENGNAVKDENGNKVYDVHEGKNFRILASNDPNFSVYEILVNWVTYDVGIDRNMKNYSCRSSKAYRYIRYVRQGSGALGDIYVYSDDEGSALSKQGCKDNNIEGNYIADIGLTYADSIGIQVFYTDNTNIKNNTIRNVPSTGISMGWGWERQKNSLDVKNNKIINNRIEDSLMSLRDGAGIYILGMQPGLEISGNYIKGIRNSFGGIYPDNGVVGYSFPQKTAYPIVIKNNVVEDAPMWFHGWHCSNEYLQVSDNFTTTSRQKNALNNADPNEGIEATDTCYVKNTKIFIKSNPPEEVKNIIENAGLGGDINEYMRNNFLHDTKKNLMDEVTVKNKATKLVGAFVLRQPNKEIKVKKERYEDTALNYLNTTANISAEGYTPSGKHRTENLEWIIYTYNYYSYVLENNPEYLIGYENEYLTLEEIIESIKSVRNNSSASIKTIFEARIKGEKALESFEKCGIFYDKENTTTVLTDDLINIIANK